MCTFFHQKLTTLPFLNQRMRENDHRKYLMINLHERMLLIWQGSSLQPPDNKSDAHPTEPSSLADPDQMLQFATSSLGLHCLLRPVCPNTQSNYGNLIKSNPLRNHPDLPLTIIFIVNVLKFRTSKWLIKWHIQTVQTQIRLLLKEQSDQVQHCLPFH